MRASLIVSSLLASSLLLLPAVAHAGDVFSSGVGVLLGGGVVGLGKPGDTSVTVGGATGNDTTYPGFFGTTVGAGISAEARIVGIVGLEVDALYQFSERAQGDLTLGNATYTISIGQPAFHVPILAKVVAPLPVVRPFAAIGPELVFPGDGTAEVTGPNASAISTKIAAKADSYVMLAAALGVEIKLPLSSVDLRIPVALRFGLNPGTSDKVVDRREATLKGNTVTAITYKSEWQYQGTLTAGLSYWF